MLRRFVAGQWPSRPAVTDRLTQLDLGLLCNFQRVIASGRSSTPEPPVDIRESWLPIWGRLTFAPPVLRRARAQATTARRDRCRHPSRRDDPCVRWAWRRAAPPPKREWAQLPVFVILDGSRSWLLMVDADGWPLSLKQPNQHWLSCATTSPRALSLPSSAFPYAPHRACWHLPRSGRGMPWPAPPPGYAGQSSPAAYRHFSRHPRSSWRLRASAKPCYWRAWPPRSLPLRRSPAT